MAERGICPACGSRLSTVGAPCAYCAAEARHGTARHTAAAMLLLGLAVADGGCTSVAMYGFTYVPDQDGDGYDACLGEGDTADTDADTDGSDVPACDCDDQAEAFHPGATETPGDGHDSNCDGDDDT